MPSADGGAGCCGSGAAACGWGEVCTGAGADGCGEGAGAARGVAACTADAGAACVSELSIRIVAPFETLSPTFTFTSCTTPSASAGTSMEAFSLSSVISESFFFTRSPGLTKTSITGTSLKSPMSGTRTSIVSLIDDPFYTVMGLGLFGSIAYFLSALSTMEGWIEPSSASARSAATVTK